MPFPWILNRIKGVIHEECQRQLKRGESASSGEHSPVLCAASAVFASSKPCAPSVYQQHEAPKIKLCSFGQIPETSHLSMRHFKAMEESLCKARSNMLTDGRKVQTTQAHRGDAAATANDEQTEEISYTDVQVVGNGSFGVVYKATLVGEERTVAIKKVFQDKRFKNRELNIMRELHHLNVVNLRYYFYSHGAKDSVYLNLLLEYVPETVYRIARHYQKHKRSMPVIYIKLYMYQMFRALAYIHSKGICHRDIKPQNLLVNPETAVLKICDFGSAKHLISGEPNVSYICSRYYRAPELIFGASYYTVAIDVWSTGCVMAELLLGKPIFPGDSVVDQLVEIIKILGTPTREEINDMNPNYSDFKFPQIKSHPWQKVFPAETPQNAIDLGADLLKYRPTCRLTPLTACTHEFFDDLRKSTTKLPNGKALPPLFNLTEHERSIEPHLNHILVRENSQCSPETSNSSSSQADSTLSSLHFSTSSSSNATSFLSGSLKG